MKTFLAWLTSEKIFAFGLLALGFLAGIKGEWPTAGLVVTGAFALLKGEKNEKADTVSTGGTP